MIHDNVIPIIAISGAFVVAICCSAIYYAYMAWKRSSDNALKRDMVARGYTADEIIAVIASSGRSNTATSSKMVEFHYAAEEIIAAIAAEQGTISNRLLPSVPPAKPIKQPAYSP